MKPLATIIIITFVGFFISSTVRLTIPLLLTDLRVPLIYIGAVMTAHPVTVAVLSVPLGLASDRVGRKKMLTISFLLLLTSSLILAAVRDLLGIFIAFTLMAVGWAAFEPTVTAMIGDVTKSNELGRAYGTFAATIQAGFSSGPAVAGTLITFFGFSSPFILSAPVLVATILFLNWALRREEKTKAISRQDNVANVFVTLLHRKPVFTGWLAISSIFVTIGGYEAFFPVYARHIGMEPWLIGLLFTAQFIIGLIARIPVGTLLDKVPDKVPAMIFGVAASAFAVALIPFFTHPWILLLLMGSMSISRSGANIGGLLLVSSGSTKTQRGLAQGVTSSVRNIGASAGPTIFSLAASGAGFTLGFISISAIALPVSLALMRLRKGVKDEANGKE
ncbi:MAG: MFS transporter [Thaumarchaeota archaeon]|nr:MFS transporter [Nitrososphaerota archaeon]